MYISLTNNCNRPHGQEVVRGSSRSGSCTKLFQVVAGIEEPHRPGACESAPTKICTGGNTLTTRWVTTQHGPHITGVHRRISFLPLPRGKFSDFEILKYFGAESHL